MSRASQGGGPTLSSEGLDRLANVAAARRMLGFDESVFMRSSFVTAVNALLAGTCDADMRERAEAVAARRLMPPGMAEILPGIGINPVGMMALALLKPQEACEVHLGGRRVAYLDFDNHDMFLIVLGHAPGGMEIQWREDRILMPAVPDTVMGALAGRPLADVLSHPILDPLGLTIEEVHLCWEDDRLMEVRTSLHAADGQSVEMFLARVAAIVARLRDLGIDVEGLETMAIAGTDPVVVMPAQKHARVPTPVSLGLNHELLGRMSDGDLQHVVMKALPEWRAQR